MRSPKQFAAILFALIVVPVSAATVQALPPAGFTRVNPDDFHPVVIAEPVRPLTIAVAPTPKPYIAPIIESIALAPTPPTRPKLDLPTVKAKSVAIAPKNSGGGSAQFVGSSGNGRLSGNASWYCGNGSICPNGYSGGMYAAAGPALRAAICGVQSCTSWRGKTVSVNGYAVTLVDWCQCYWKRSNEKVIDLFWYAWNKTGARGGVTISW